jgi:hypothetical protein
MTLAPERDDSVGGAHAAGGTITDDSARDVAARLQEPKTAAALDVLLDHADLLAVIVESLDQFLARSEVIGDSLISGISELRETAGASGALSLEGLDLKSATEAGRRLMGSGMLSADTLDQLAVLARGLAQGRESFGTDPVEVKGALGALRLLKDPDINRAISYGATVLRAVGRELDAPRVVATDPIHH